MFEVFLKLGMVERLSPTRSCVMTRLVPLITGTQEKTDVIRRLIYVTIFSQNNECNSIRTELHSKTDQETRLDPITLLCLTNGMSLLCLRFSFY